jgi:hypothetical protein
LCDKWILRDMLDEFLISGLFGINFGKLIKQNCPNYEELLIIAFLPSLKHLLFQY